MKKILPVFLALLIAFTNATNVFACTGVYVGSEVSENGSTYMGRSEDIGDVYGKVFGVAPSRTIAEGEVYEDTYGFVLDYNEIDFDYPTTTYAYTYVRDSVEYEETMQDEEGNYIGEAYGEAGQNEKGLSMSATVSTYYNDDADAVDPLLWDGICEISLTSVILAGAATAREAVDLLAAIVDVYGAGECNQITFSDANETWYFEIVSGHQYAAIKLPEDKVFVNPNIMLLGVIDVTDTENVVASENLVKLAEDNGFLETDENGNIHVAKTYAQENNGLGQYSRYWQGLYYVNEEAAAELDYTTIDMGTDPVDLLLDTNKTFTTMDVLKLLAYRGEGTQYDSNENSSIYAIGNNRQAECHIFETRTGYATELATIQWQAMADAEFSVYVPYYSALLTEASDLYSTEVTAPWWRSQPEECLEFTMTYETEGQINTNFQSINYLCYNNRDLVADEVKEYLEAYQQSLIDQQVAVDAVMVDVYAHGVEAAQVAATALGNKLAEQVSAMSSAVLAEIRAYLAGDQTEAFALSEETKALMPDYSLDEEYLPEHTWEVKSDEEGHWQECTLCGETTEREAHTYEDEKCTVCDHKEPVGDSPATSDNYHVMAYAAMMLLAIAGVVVLKSKKSELN